MDYNELLLTFSKLNWKFFYGYYTSFLNWGIIIQKEQEIGNNYINVEKHCKDNIVKYDIEFGREKELIIDKQNLSINDYIMFLNQALKIMVCDKLPSTISITKN